MSIQNQKNNKLKKLSSRIFSSRKAQLVMFAAIFAVIGSALMWRSFAQDTLPDDPNEVVLQYSNEVPAVLIQGEDNIQSVVQASSRTQVTSDGTVYCESNLELNTGKISRNLLKRIIKEASETGITKENESREQSSTQAQVNNFEAITINADGNAQLITSLTDSTKTDVFTRAVNRINRVCENAKTKISDFVKPAVKQPRLQKNNKKVISRLLEKLTPKVSAAAGQSGTAEAHQIAAINYTRQGNGRNQLPQVDCLARAARHWSYQMAASVGLTHTSIGSYVNSYCGSAWKKAGENIGVSPIGDSAQLFRAFVNSPPHYANILDPVFDRMGVGAWVREDGSLWVSQIFALCPGCTGSWANPPAPVGPPPPPPTTITGRVDNITCKTVRGWAVDISKLNSSMPIHLHFSNVDNTGLEIISYGNTDKYRSDVNSFFKGIEGNHGFNFDVPSRWSGKYFTVRVYGIDNKTNPLLGQGSVTNCGVTGWLDVNSCTTISGWAYDRTRPGNQVHIDVYIKNVNGTGRVGYALGNTSVLRSDVNAVYGISGNHGFIWNLPAAWKNKPHITEVHAVGPNSTKYLGGVQGRTCG